MQDKLFNLVQRAQIQAAAIDLAELLAVHGGRHSVDGVAGVVDPLTMRHQNFIALLQAIVLRSKALGPEFQVQLTDLGDVADPAKPDEQFDGVDLKPGQAGALDNQDGIGAVNHCVGIQRVLAG